MLDAASEDVLVHILASFCDVHAVVATLRSCTSLRRRLSGCTPRAAVAALWRRLHLRQWPASSLFQLNKRQLRLAAAAAPVDGGRACAAAASPPSGGVVAPQAAQNDERRPRVWLWGPVAVWLPLGRRGEVS